MTVFDALEILLFAALVVLGVLWLRKMGLK